MRNKLVGFSALTGVLLAAPAAAVEWDVAVNYTAEYTSNTARTTDNEIEEWIHQPGLSVGATHDGPNLELNGGYNFERRIFEEDLFDDENVTTGSAELLWHVVPERLDLAHAFGATDTLNTDGLTTKQTIKAVRDLTDGIGVDAAMEVAGTPAVLSAGLGALRVGGRYVWHGNVFPGADFNYDASEIIFRMLTVTGVHNYATPHLQRAVDFLERTQGRFPFEHIVGRSFPLHEINNALRAAASGEAIRVAVHP